MHARTGQAATRHVVPGSAQTHAGHHVTVCLTGKLHVPEQHICMHSTEGGRGDTKVLNSLERAGKSPCLRMLLEVSSVGILGFTGVTTRVGGVPDLGSAYASPLGQVCVTQTQNVCIAARCDPGSSESANKSLAEAAMRHAVPACTRDPTPTSAQSVPPMPRPPTASLFTLSGVLGTFGPFAPGVDRD